MKMQYHLVAPFFVKAVIDLMLTNSQNMTSDTFALLQFFFISVRFCIVINMPFKILKSSAAKKPSAKKTSGTKYHQTGVKGIGGTTKLKR